MFHEGFHKVIEKGGSRIKWILKDKGIEEENVSVALNRFVNGLPGYFEV